MLVGNLLKSALRKGVQQYFATAGKETVSKKGQISQVTFRDNLGDWSRSGCSVRRRNPPNSERFRSRGSIE